MSRAIVYAEWWWTCDYCGAICEEPYDSEPEALLASDEHECETEAKLKRWQRKTHKANKLGFSNPDWRPSPPLEPTWHEVIPVQPNEEI